MREKIVLPFFDQVINKTLKKLMFWMFGGMIGVAVEKENFKELKSVELRYNKTDKELNTKDIRRLKWLPKEAIPLTAFF